MFEEKSGTKQLFIIHSHFVDSVQGFPETLESRENDFMQVKEHKKGITIILTQ